MQIDQIIVHPTDKTVLIEYSDNVGRTNNISYDGAGNTTIAALISDAQQRVPREQDRPDKSEVEQEIEELEYRLTQLKLSIGAS